MHFKLLDCLNFNLIENYDTSFIQKDKRKKLHTVHFLSISFLFSLPFPSIFPWFDMHLM